MMNPRLIISSMSLCFLLLSGCKEQEGHFLEPYFGELLSCIEPDHPYLEEAVEQNFELSDDPEVFTEENQKVLPHVVFDHDADHLCSDVKIEESWWNSLPEEFASEEERENGETVRKLDAARILFFTCFMSHLTGHKGLDVPIGSDEGMKAIEELNKVLKKCPEALPFNTQSDWSKALK